MKARPKPRRHLPYDYEFRAKSRVTPQSLAAEYADLQARAPDPLEPFLAAALPAGWAYLVDADGAYLIDSDGAYLTAPAA